MTTFSVTAADNSAISLSEFPSLNNIFNQQVIVIQAIATFNGLGSVSFKDIVTDKIIILQPDDICTYSVGVATGFAPGLNTNINVGTSLTEAGALRNRFYFGSTDTFLSSLSLSFDTYIRTGGTGLYLIGELVGDPGVGQLRILLNVWRRIN